MEIVHPRGVAQPAGHYSHAVVHGGLVYVSGQLPVRDGELTLVEGSVEEQAGQAIENLRRVLEAAGSSLGRVIKTTVYVSDISLWERVNREYARAFGAHRPARSVVPTLELHHGFCVEIEAIAASG